jgi:hypothetical protein
MGSTFLRALMMISVLGSASCAVEDDPVTATDEAAVVVGANIPRGSNWAVWDRGGDLGTAWRARVFDDSSWEVEHGPLGYGENYVNLVSYGPSSTNKYITTYFRTQFEVADPSTVVALAGELMYDDGLVVYLNGTEVTRRAMPAGTITAATLASGHEANNKYESVDWTAVKHLLVAGVNTIAVEVHQAGPTSSDLVFDLSLRVETASAGGIARGSVWSYWDAGGDLGTAWRAVEYDDTTWGTGAGPLGYGETYLATTTSYGSDPNHKPITTYFRRDFAVADPAAISRVTGEVMFDDGFVVYLNGTQIGGASMPAGTPTATTPALGHEAGNTYVAYDWSAARALLRAGTNTIAVEVHQAGETSSDLVFDLALSLETAPPPPPEPEAHYGIPRFHTWSYFDGGGDLGTAWRQPTYDDSGWKRGKGPLGYGETYIATTTKPQITTYFRATFLAEKPPYNFQAMVGRAMYDDGFVVYLNGKEVARKAMPSGTITASTLATSHEATSGVYESWDWTNFHTYLVPGENVLAVEVHQSSSTSSDLVFDLQLDLNVIPLFTRRANAPLLEDLHNPSIVREPDGTWVMFVDDGFVFDPQIYRATSTDGVQWTVDPEPVWRGDQASVLLDGTTYRMWYHVHRADEYSSIAYATSPDGIHWTGDGVPVIRGGEGWASHVFAPSVVRDGNLYKMWYEGEDAVWGEHWRVGYATSPDGVTWTTRASPVMLSRCKHLTVIRDHDEYRMWFVAEGDQAIQYAASKDGISWARYEIAMALHGTPGAFDEYVDQPTAARDADSDTLRLWYIGFRSGSPTYGLGHATHP